MRHCLRGFWLLALFIGGAGLMSGCKACNRGSPVPFKRGEKANSRQDTASPSASSPNSGLAPAIPFQPLIGAKYPEGMTEVEQEGAKLGLPQGWFAGSLFIDLDQDGDLDALLLATDRDAPAVLKYAERRLEGFSELQEVGTLIAARTGCQVGDAEIRTLATAFASIVIRRVCPESAEPSGAPGTQPAPAPPAQTTPPTNAPTAGQPATTGSARTSSPSISEQHAWVVGLQLPPRIIEHFAIGPAADSQADGMMGMELKGQDFDQDGYTDIFINISYKPTGSNVPVAADLIWFNRTSGLARDPGQPEKALADLVNPASALLARDIDQALAKAEHVLAVHRVLCRESGMARFAVGDSNGIACGLSAAAGKAAAVKTAALAKKGQFYKALAAYSALNFRAFRVDETDRRLASDALNAMAPVANAAWQEGPSHQLAPGPAVRLSAIAFIDENTLVLRGPVPLVYDLTTGALTPAERSQGNTLVRDPSERYAIVQIFRGCEGYKLRIVDAALARVARPESEKIVSEPLIEARPVPAGAGCSERPAIPSADDGGFRVLGWGAKGIVLAKAGRLWLLTVDTEAQALSEPVALAPNRPPPGPLWAGALAPGGRAYALLTAVGIVVKELASPPTSYLLRPPQWDYARTTDAAVSPSGKKVALLSGGRVTIATVTPNPNP